MHFFVDFRPLCTDAPRACLCANNHKEGLLARQQQQRDAKSSFLKRCNLHLKCFYSLKAFLIRNARIYSVLYKEWDKISFWIYCCRRCRCWSPSKNPNLIKYIFAGLGSKQVVLWYLHIWLTLNHFRATRPDSHSTISIIIWYLLLKIWIFSTIFSHI